MCYSLYLHTAHIECGHTTLLPPPGPPFCSSWRDYKARHLRWLQNGIQSGEDEPSPECEDKPYMLLQTSKGLCPQCSPCQQSQQSQHEIPALAMRPTTEHVERESEDIAKVGDEDSRRAVHSVPDRPHEATKTIEVRPTSESPSRPSVSEPGNLVRALTPSLDSQLVSVSRGRVEKWVAQIQSLTEGGCVWDSVNDVYPSRILHERQPRTVDSLPDGPQANDSTHKWAGPECGSPREEESQDPRKRLRPRKKVHYAVDSVSRDAASSSARSATAPRRYNKRGKRATGKKSGGQSERKAVEPSRRERKKERVRRQTQHTGPSSKIEATPTSPGGEQALPVSSRSSRRIAGTRWSSPDKEQVPEGREDVKPGAVAGKDSAVAAPPAGETVPFVRLENGGFARYSFRSGAAPMVEFRELKRPRPTG